MARQVPAEEARDVAHHQRARGVDRATRGTQDHELHRETTATPDRATCGRGSVASREVLPVLNRAASGEMPRCG